MNWIETIKIALKEPNEDKKLHLLIGIKEEITQECLKFQKVIDDIGLDRTLVNNSITVFEDNKTYLKRDKVVVSIAEYRKIVKNLKDNNRTVDILNRTENEAKAELKARSKLLSEIHVYIRKYEPEQNNQECQIIPFGKVS